MNIVELYLATLRSINDASDIDAFSPVPLLYCLTSIAVRSIFYRIPITTVLTLWRRTRRHSLSSSSAPCGRGWQRAPRRSVMGDQSIPINRRPLPATVSPPHDYRSPRTCSDQNQCPREKSISTLPTVHPPTVLPVPSPCVRRSRCGRAVRRIRPAFSSLRPRTPAIDQFACDTVPPISLTTVPPP